jgi:aconitate hydratase
LALTFANPADYDKVRQDDVIDIVGFDTFAPDKNLAIVLHHADGTSEQFEVEHTYNQQQIDWVKAGSALNKIREEFGA